MAKRKTKKTTPAADPTMGARERLSRPEMVEELPPTWSSDSAPSSASRTSKAVCWSSSWRCRMEGSWR
jgi:hypothetical protein